MCRDLSEEKQYAILIKYSFDKLKQTAFFFKEVPPESGVGLNFTKTRIVVTLLGEETTSYLLDSSDLTFINEISPSSSVLIFSETIMVMAFTDKFRFFSLSTGTFLKERPTPHTPNTHLTTLRQTSGDVFGFIIDKGISFWSFHKMEHLTNITFDHPVQAFRIRFTNEEAVLVARTGKEREHNTLTAKELKQVAALIAEENLYRDPEHELSSVVNPYSGRGYRRPPALHNSIVQIWHYQFKEDQPPSASKSALAP